MKTFDQWPKPPTAQLTNWSGLNYIYPIISISVIYFAYGTSYEFTNQTVDYTIHFMLKKSQIQDDGSICFKATFQNIHSDTSFAFLIIGI